jgi:hypothetical protein
MKNLETDKDLVDLIVKTLDKHEEHYILGSWENFARARKKKRRFIFWFSASGIAASLLVGWIGYRILFTHESQPADLAQTINAETAQPLIQKQNAEARNSETAQVNAATENVSKTFTPPEKYKITPVLQQSNSREEKVETPLASEKPLQESMTRQSVISDNVIEGLPFRYDARMKNGLSASLLSYPDQVRTDAPKEDLYSGPTEPPVHKKRLRMGVNVAPGMTSTSTVSSFNYSGGINADIMLTDNIHISTGLQLEHQTAVNRSTDTPSWLPAGQTQAMLTDLDLPVNLTWKFLNRKTSSYYVTGGFSSVAYLSEKYVNTNYTQKLVTVVNSTTNYNSVTYELTNVKNTDRRTEDPLSTLRWLTHT